VKRYKKVQKIMRYYQNSFDIKDPYKIMCDPTFIYQSLEKKLHIKEQLPKLLGGRVTPMVTNCGMAELRRLRKEIGDQFIGSIVIAKGLYRVKCPHVEPLGAAKCYEEQIKEGDKKWIVATQDETLRTELRKIPGVPILYLAGQVPTLEPPSESSSSSHIAREQDKMTVGQWEKPKLVEKERLATLAAIAAEAAAAKKKKRKKEHHPHPLSNLKKKKKPKKNEGKVKKTEGVVVVAQNSSHAISSSSSTGPQVPTDAGVGGITARPCTESQEQNNKSTNTCTSTNVVLISKHITDADTPSDIAPTGTHEQNEITGVLVERTHPMKRKRKVSCATVRSEDVNVDESLGHAAACGSSTPPNQVSNDLLASSADRGTPKKEPIPNANDDLASPADSHDGKMGNNKVTTTQSPLMMPDLDLKTVRKDASKQEGVRKRRTKTRSRKHKRGEKKKESEEQEETMESTDRARTSITMLVGNADSMDAVMKGA